MFSVTKEKVMILYLIMFAFALIFHTIVYGFIYLVPNYTITINSQTKPVFVVGERFLSFGIDTVVISNGVDDAHLESVRLQNLTSLLGPSRLRLGGTMSDRLIFKEILNDPLNDLPYFSLSGKDWIKINEFCLKTNARLLFDFNVLLRSGDKWDPENAIDLLNFSYKQNFTDKIDWQLGNEPNSFPHVFNVSIPAEQLSRDFIVLKNILRMIAPNSALAGPDTTRPQPKRPSCVQYMKDFLIGLTASQGRNAISNYLDAVAWHQYYLNGHIAKLEDFWNPDTFELLQNQIDTMKENIDSLRGNIPMWLSETSSAYGGGAPGLSDSFASSPLWLDKLGIAALNGIEIVVRQSLFGAHYCLLDEDLNPLPDWWISFIYKRLVGREVVSCNLSASKYQRFYCHCSAKSAKNHKGSSVTIFGMNLHESQAYFHLSGSSVDKDILIEEYLLTSPNNNRTSKDILLNGKLLEYDGNLPKLIPKKINHYNFDMPGYSLGFWILRNVKNIFCS